jgi:hypothetical protein
LAEVTSPDVLGYVLAKVWPPKLSGDCPLGFMETTMPRVRGVVTLMQDLGFELCAIGHHYLVTFIPQAICFGKCLRVGLL